MDAMRANSRSLPLWKTVLTWICRLAVGAIFIFSGMSKAIDTWGTLYKMEDYVGAMNLTWFGPEVLLTGAFFLFTLEAMVGVFLVTGSFRRFAPVMTLLFMVVMLPLTLWIALYNPVADCGCFGDAWVISNWATFWKNVAITAAGVWLLIYNRRTHWLITPALQWIAFVVSGLFVVGIGVIGYRVQPLIDFRDYKVGEPLVTADDDSQTTHYTFIYEKDGVKKEFGENDELPDEQSGWKYVDRKEVAPSQKGVSGVQKALRVWNPDDEEDVTGEVMGGPGDSQLVLMIPSLKDVSIASTWKINSLQEWAARHDTDFIAVVAATPEQIEEWKDVSMADYPIYTAEDTSIKEAVRGNPAVIYTVDGKIKSKSTLSALRGDDFMGSEDADTPQSLFIDLTTLVKDAGVLYLSIMAVLIMFSFVPKMFGGRSFFPRRNKKRRDVNGDDKVPPSELSSHDTPAQ